MTDSRRARSNSTPDDRDAVSIRWLFTHLGVSGKPVAPTAIFLCAMVLVTAIVIVWILAR